jgi:hypothetical protein
LNRGPLIRPAEWLVGHQDRCYSAMMLTVERFKGPVTENFTLPLISANRV